MTLDPKALDAARKAAAAHITGAAPRWESGAAAAERIVSAYVAALGRDPLVDAARAVADCATSDGVCADGHAWADGFALGCESCEPTRRACARLNAALGEGDKA